MATKADFSPDEWKKLLESPLLAGLVIGGVVPGGFLSTLNQGIANAPALAEAKMNPSADELIKAVTEDLMTSEGCANAHEGIKDRALAQLKQAAAIVDAKAPADAAAFKAWLGHIAQVVAEAGSEGGILGFGGAQVSDKEKVTLAEISKVLGV